MCGGADTAATVKGNTTREQDDAQRQKNRENIAGSDVDKKSKDEAIANVDEGARKANDANASASSYAENEKKMQGFGIAPPPDSPDITDELLRKRRAAEATNLMLGRGRKDTMRSSNFGDMSIPKTKTYGGGS